MLQYHLEINKNRADSQEEVWRGVKIFIAWSKGVSKNIGLELERWLNGLNEAVFQTVISEQAIPIGSVWHNKLDEALQSANCGILCVTEENLTSPWLCYESGALSMSTARQDKKSQSDDNLREPYVAPILFGDISSSQVADPIQRFQSIKFNRKNMLELVLQLNKRSLKTDKPYFMPLEKLETEFERTYEAFETKIQAILREGIPARVQLMRQLNETMEQLEGLNAAATGDNPVSGNFSPELDELNAALTEFERYDSSEKTFRTLFKMGGFLFSSICKEGLTESVRHKAQQYRGLLQRSRDMTDTPSQSRALQRLLNALSALL